MSFRNALLLLFVLAFAPATAQNGLPGGPGAQIPNSSGGGSSSSGFVNSLGLVNVTNYAPGVSIGDGNAHTVGTAPAGTVFNGVTTLAGLAAITINGARPFFFLTDSGTITGPMCTPSSTTNCFLNGVYALTNSSVANMDIGWLAIQAAILQGKAYIPAGKYNIGSTENLPLMIPLASQIGTIPQGVPTTIATDGAFVSLIQAGHDFGSGVPLMACGDPAGTSGNSLGRYANSTLAQCQGVLRDVGLLAPSTCTIYPAKGTTACGMTGLATGARLNDYNLLSAGFGVDLDIVGDNTSHVNPLILGGVKGVRWNVQNVAAFGGQTFLNLNASGQSFASLSVAPGASISGNFNGYSYIGGSMYGILGEAASGGGCTSIMFGVTFDMLFNEFIGEETIADDSGFSGGTYTDANKCRSVDKVDIVQWQNSFNNGSSDTTASGRGRRATFDVNQISINIQRMVGDSFSLTPNVVTAPNAVAVPPVAFINAKGIGDAFGGINLGGDVTTLISQLAALPIAAGDSNSADYPSINLYSAYGFTGSVGLFTSVGNYTTTVAGDLLEVDGFSNVAPGGTNNIASSPVAGVSLQAGITNGKAVPYANSGVFNVNTGWNTSFFNLIGKSTGIGPTLTLVAGSGYTNGTYTWTATGGGCSTEPVGTVTVAGAVLTSATIGATTQGVGCTSTPTIPIPGGAGAGSGGSITPRWPAGNGLNVVNPITTGFIGTAVGGNNSVGGGGNFLTVKLQGLR